MYTAAPSATSTSLASLSALPDELLLHVLERVDDTDLQTLRRTSHTFRRLSGDLLLWRHIHLVRNSHLINTRLFRPSRPDRRQLISQNIMQGVHAHQLDRGVYVAGAGVQLFAAVQQRMETMMVRSVVRRSLDTRPRVEDLQRRGVMPSYVTGGARSVSPLLVPRVAVLRRAFRQSLLKRQLAHRTPFPEVHAQGLTRGIDALRLTSPRLVATKLELERQFQEHRLRGKIERRPSAVEMERARLLDARACARMVCPGVRAKIRTFNARAAELSAEGMSHV